MIELARLLLAAVFAVAGAAKIADLRGSQAALRGFGVPSRLASPLAIVLPLVELAIAGALVPAATARYAALVGLSLLALFGAGIAWSLIHGRTPECHCFGQLHSAPAGWTTLARNVALAGLAAFVLMQPASSASALQLGASAAVGLIASQALLSYKLLRRYGRALQRVAELEAGGPESPALEPGAEAPAFVLPTVAGGEVSLESLLARRRPVLLVFADPGCGPCRALLPDLARWQHGHREELTVAVVSHGGARENAMLAEEHGLETVLVQEGREVAELYGAYATPGAALIGVGGRLAHGLVAGASAIEELARSVVSPPVATPEPASKGVTKVAAAAALVGGLTTAVAAPADASPGGGAQRPSDPELRAIAAILMKAGPRIVKSVKRVQNALAGQASVVQSAEQRRKRAAVVRALAEERDQILIVRAELEMLQPAGAAAQSVRADTLQGFSLLAQSLRKQERAIVATPRAGARLLDQSQDLSRRSLLPFISAAEYLRRG